MKMIKTVIHVQPMPKGRPRFRVSTKGKRQYVQTYTPANTRDAEAMIKAVIRTQLMTKLKFFDGQPLSLTASFYVEKPKSARKKDLLPTRRPDLSNYLALLQDALNKFIYKDDAQITTLLVKKRFGTPPRIELLLREDEITV